MIKISMNQTGTAQGMHQGDSKTPKVHYPNGSGQLSSRKFWSMHNSLLLTLKLLVLKQCFTCKSKHLRCPLHVGHSLTGFLLTWTATETSQEPADIFCLHPTSTWIFQMGICICSLFVCMPMGYTFKLLEDKHKPLWATSDTARAIPHPFLPNFYRPPP